jgi:hypothetical protein
MSTSTATTINATETPKKTQKAAARSRKRAITVDSKPSAAVEAALKTVDTALLALENKEDHAVVAKMLQDLKLELSKPAEGGAAKREAKKRAPSDFNLFVRDAMKLEDVQALPAKERMKAASAIWKAYKAESVEVTPDPTERLAAATLKWKNDTPADTQ